MVLDLNTDEVKREIPCTCEAIAKTVKRNMTKLIDKDKEYLDIKECGEE